MIARPSVASLLLIARANRHEISTATGFVVKRGQDRFLITNWHVAAGRRTDTGQPLSPTAAVPDELIVFHNVAGRLGNWQGQTESLYDSSGVPLWFEHPTHGRGVDVVALPITTAAGYDFHPHDPWNTGPDIAFGAGGSVSIVGFPFGMTGGGAFGIWVQGFVATEPMIDFDDLPCFLVDSRTRQGQSGSPVLVYSAGGMTAMSDGGSAVFGGPVERFLGVYSGRVNPQSDLGIVWKAATVVEIVEAARRGVAT